MMKLLYRLSYFLILPVMISACSQQAPSDESSTGQQTVTQDSVPDQLLKNVDAQQIQQIISSYKGDKSVLVNVWATWCAPCIEEFPHIVEIQRKYPQQLQVIFISADFPDARDRALKFLKDHNVDWTTYFKDAKDEPFINALSPDWSGALPFTKIINKQGEEVIHWENKASFDTFNKHVQQAINPD